MPNKIYAVIDTNEIVSALISKDPEAAPLSVMALAQKIGLNMELENYIINFRSPIKQYHYKELG